ncbi:MAG: SDR family oxidoreductase [Bacteroidetes bacterium]|nr:SDR family oxidoreductase [Bacteroidota bacterium]
MRAFIDIALGEKATVKHLLTEEDVRRFTSLTGDDNRLHVDPTFAAGTTFSRPVVHGMLGASFISTLIGTKLPGDGALWHRQTLEFIRPVFVGDRLTVTAVVTAKQSRSRTIILDVVIRNQRRQVVTKGEAHVRVLEQNRKAEVSAVSSNEVKGGVFIAGGSGGIGSVTAKLLASREFPVALHYHGAMSETMDIIDDIRKKGGTAVSVTADVRSQKEVLYAITQAEARLGSLSSLVYSVTGPLESPEFDVLDWSDFEQSLAIEVHGAWNAVRAILPIFRRNGGGSIVFISSQVVDAPNADWMPYITAKAALEGFARSLALALAPDHIRVNIVAPGMTDTALIAGLPSIARTRVQSTAPLRRLADARDVAGAIAFLLSDDAAYCTGETIRVNGGQVMR